LLMTAGELGTEMFGPGVKPRLPPSISQRYSWKVSKNKADWNRRSVYIFAKRNLPYPLLNAFDLPDMHESCARRSQTIIAPQALMLLNSGLVLDSATSFANRLLKEQSNEIDLSLLVQNAYLIAFGRPANSEEVAEAIPFIRQQQKLASEESSSNSETTAAVVAPKPTNEIDRSLKTAVVAFCHALINANEFIYVE